MKHSNVCMHSIITSVLALAMSFQSPAALQCSAETAISDDKDLVITKDYDSNTPVLSKMGFYDANGNLVPIGTETDFDSDIASLKAQIADGESSASKTGSFATEEDAKNGIAKIVLDAVGKPVTPAYDIVLVLDESGSMNMSMKAGNSAGDHKKLSPDLNPDHYYGIPAELLNDSGSGNAYFQLSEFGSDAFVPWSSFGDIWAQIKAKYGVRDSVTMNQWQPWNNLYKKESDGSFTNILPIDTTEDFTSPVDDHNNFTNTDGCIDRMMMEKQQALALSESILNSGDDARIAVVGFNNGLSDPQSQCDLTNDLETIHTALDYFKGADNTDYTAGLQKAMDILNARTDKSRKASVIFVTDGEPYYGDKTDDQNNFDTVSSALKSIATVYATGINTGESNMTNLARVSSGEGYYFDCDTVDDFTSTMNSLSQKVLVSEQPVLHDSIGSDYALYIDDTHPVTENQTSYSSVGELPSNILYNSDSKSFDWTLSSGSEYENGERLSFYIQLDPTKDSLTSTSGQYSTNGDAELTYHKLLTDGTQDPNLTTIPLSSPSVKFDISNFPAELTSDKMTNNDPSVPGQQVQTGDTILYTITIHNNGDLDSENLAVKDYVPEYTTFDSIVTGDGTYSKESNSITWTIPEFKVGTDTTVQFRVKVKDVSKTAELETVTDTFSWGWGTASEYAAKDPICKGNTLNNPTPGNAEPTATAVPGTGSDRDRSFCVTFLDCRGNTVSVQWIKYGESASIPAGYGYPEVSNVSANMDIHPGSCAAKNGFAVPNTADKYN